MGTHRDTGFARVVRLGEDTDTVQTDYGYNCGEEPYAKDGNEGNFLSKRSWYRNERLHRQDKDPYIRDNVDNRGCCTSISIHWGLKSL